MATYIVDIDGTIANNKHREWTLKQEGGPARNWEMFFQLMGDDTPIYHMLELLYLLEARDYESGVPDNEIVYVTGRPERWRFMTEQWLKDHSFPRGDRLYMRKDGDRRPDHIIKLEILGEMRADGFRPTMAFDDRDEVVKMWRANGVPCAQVAEGRF